MFPEFRKRGSWTLRYGERAVRVVREQIGTKRTLSIPLRTSYARIGGHAIARPLLQRRPESVVQRFLGEIEVAQQAD